MEKGERVNEKRCAGTKPNGRSCNTLFFRYENTTIELKCQRCNTMHYYDLRVDTAGAEQTVDFDKPYAMK